MMGVFRKITIATLALMTVFGYKNYAFNNNDQQTAYVETEPKNLVYLGGESINIKMDAMGVIITKNNGIVQEGDILYKINDISVNNRNELNNVKNSIETADTTITYLHNNEVLTNIITNDDLKTIEGINNLVGNATITYINPSNLRYAAVAHSIIENVSINNNNIGNINNNHINSIVKSTDESVGHFIASKGNPLGTIDTINDTGMYGKYYKVINKNLVEIGSAKVGKAYIVTTLDTNKKAYYEINITAVKTNQTKMQIEYTITDQNLINKTNGIIKGMSGSPIVQDNKLVGAVSHAVNSSNNRGYGLLIEKMITNTK